VGGLDRLVVGQSRRWRSGQPCLLCVTYWLLARNADQIRGNALTKVDAVDSGQDHCALQEAVRTYVVSPQQDRMFSSRFAQVLVSL
jgi:hypothetical protein